MKKMNVITFKKTGHVLAAVSRATQPETAVTVEQVAAGGIRMRNASGDKIALTIKESELGVQLVDYKTEVLHQPQLFVLEDGQPEQKTAKPITASYLSLTQEIKVTLPDPVSSSTNVWCQISGGSEPIVRSITVPGTTAAPTKEGKEALTLSNGTYQIALFAPGYVVVVVQLTI